MDDQRTNREGSRRINKRYAVVLGLGLALYVIVNGFKEQNNWEILFGLCVLWEAAKFTLGTSKNNFPTS